MRIFFCEIQISSQKIVGKFHTCDNCYHTITSHSVHALYFLGEYCILVIDRIISAETALQPHKHSRQQNRNLISLPFHNRNRFWHDSCAVAVVSAKMYQNNIVNQVSSRCLVQTHCGQCAFFDSVRFSFYSRKCLIIIRK